jgi:V/A-type H+-transporting ATPase subunit F
MNKIIVITPPDARNGFACCGALQQAVQAGEAFEVLERMTVEADSGVIILDERLIPAIGEEQLRAVEKRWPGVLVILPAPVRTAGGEDYALRLIRRAVGYQVRVKT